MNCGELLRFVKKTEEAEAIYTSHLQKKSDDTRITDALKALSSGGVLQPGPAGMSRQTDREKNFGGVANPCPDGRNTNDLDKTKIGIIFRPSVAAQSEYYRAGIL